MTRLIVVFDFFLARRVEVLLTRTVHPVLNEEKAIVLCGMLATTGVTFHVVSATDTAKDKAPHLTNFKAHSFIGMWFSVGHSVCRAWLTGVSLPCRS